MDMKTTVRGGSYEIPVIKKCDITANGLLCVSNLIDYGEDGEAGTGFGASNTKSYTDSF